ncbi:MAG: AsmA-like C-terminal region-containing protein, partial [Terriglobia bacterium]
IHNGHWPKLKMNPTVVELARIAQLGPASGDISSFSSVTAAWRLADGVLITPSIQIAGSGITGSGSGTVDLRQDGLLNYQGVGHIPAHANALTNVLAGLSGSTLRGNELSISFAVRGTLAKPVFELKPNYQALSPQQGSQKNQNQAPQVLQNLFKMLQKRK